MVCRVSLSLFQPVFRFLGALFLWKQKREESYAGHGRNRDIALLIL